MRGTNNNSNINDNNNMEPSFYEDNAQFTLGNSLKRPLTLDLNSKPQGKRQRLTQTSLALDSPDVQGFKLTTPDIERMVLTIQTPTNLAFQPKYNQQQVTSEQEDYAKGFVDALNSLRNNENSQNMPINGVVTTNGMSGGSITYTNLDDSFPLAIKDEPQTVPNSPPLSPIDMETQEKIKLERKRQRNRVAASKCRKRKLERISKLEDKVKVLKNENADLASVIKQLKEHVCTLKEQVMEHINAGCNISLYSSGIQNK